MNRRSDDIAVGTPVFSRTRALIQLLESLPEYVSTVYIADNGHTEEREHIYTDSWPFEIQAINVEYDAGIGACRYAIADRVTEPYLFVCDCDMEVTRDGDLRTLRQILQTHDDLGGVSGWLKEGDRIRTGAGNLHQYNGNIVKTIRESPEIHTEPVPHARFEFIPQAGVFRTACFDSYCWDHRTGANEHIDFFMGHKQAGEWGFASTPAVLVQHNKQIDESYREQKRKNETDGWDVVAEKYGVEKTVLGPQADWGQTEPHSPQERAFELFRQVTPARVWLPVRSTLERVGLA